LKKEDRKKERTMNIKLFLKLAILALGIFTLRAAAAPPAVTLCRDVAVLCSTDTSFGSCGYEYGEDCHTCYGDDGSTLPNSPDCN
jgi:hypothetical protein